MAKEATVRIMRHLLQPDVVQKSLKGPEFLLQYLLKKLLWQFQYRVTFKIRSTTSLFQRRHICSTASNQPVGEQTQQQYLPLEHLSGLAKYQRQPTQPQKM